MDIDPSYTFHVSGGVMLTATLCFLAAGSRARPPKKVKVH